jgi:hypothetical protein
MTPWNNGTTYYREVSATAWKSQYHANHGGYASDTSRTSNYGISLGGSSGGASTSTTSGASTSTTSGADTTTTSGASNTNNMPPYLVVYVWERVA